MADLNIVVVEGNLTRDPELRHTPSGSAVCSLRVACNGSRKTNSGEWESIPNYFDVTVWNRRGEFVAERLGKGDKVYVSGRLEWREWEAQDGAKRQAVSIVANDVKSAAFWKNGAQSSGGPDRAPASDDHFVPASAPDDDIPF